MKDSVYARHGERNGKARFTDEEARDLILEFEEWEGSMRAFARERGLPYSSARNVLMGLTYEHVHEELFYGEDDR